MLTELLKEITSYIELYPSLKAEILDFYYLAVNEIAEGGSEMHECQLALNDIEYLIKKYTDANKS